MVLPKSLYWMWQILDQTTLWPNPLLLCMRQVFMFFFCTATKGWAWCKHNIADLVERTVALRNLLLVESGCLEIPNGMAGIDSLDNKHIQQISFRQCITFCQHGSWKAGSPASNPLLLKLNLDNCSLVWSSQTERLRAQSLHCNKPGRPQLRDQTLCFSAWDWHFSVAETKGWAWCKHNAELVEPTVALRNLLLVGSGCVEIPKGKAGMDSWNKPVEQVSFRRWVTFREHGQLKGWQPLFQPTVAKSLISTMVHLFAAVTCHNWKHNIL